MDDTFLLLLRGTLVSTFSLRGVNAFLKLECFFFVRAASSISLSRTSLSLSIQKLPEIFFANHGLQLVLSLEGSPHEGMEQLGVVQVRVEMSSHGPSNSKGKDTVRVQVAENASPHIMLLNIELAALKLNLATHGINARRSTERHRNHPVHQWP